jgi:GGDEF domain-containing protein
MDHHIVTRFGGEECAILLPDATDADALALAEKVRESVARDRIRRTDQDLSALNPSAGCDRAMGRRATRCNVTRRRSCLPTST